MIEGNSIYLKHITYQDTPDIVRWRNSDFVRSRFIYREEFDEETHNNWMKTMVDTGKVVQFIIYEKTTDRKIGSVYLRDIDNDNKKCEFGIFIGEEDMLGKGYGKEAARLITNYAFNDLNLYKVYLRVLADNKRAYNSYCSSGFVEEGIAKNDVWINGKPRDVIFMAVYKEG